DDGGNVLTVSRTSRNNCVKYADGYNAYLAKSGVPESQVIASYTNAVAADQQMNTMNAMDAMGGTVNVAEETVTETVVDLSADAEPSKDAADQVRSWVVANGQTLRGVLQSWCDKEGWDLVWTTSREYPIQASAVFKGRFVDVASAVVRNFARAVPAPYAKFYKGNRVLVISASEE
ncbi:MAG: toxin co-regulated pilus biosynthesis Q family protein, partial [Alphaproteobacteria bacterium]|nr:toxin co-regulated pilus biosynthesis Q family protein [Alphaproteobacteria bacterium]